MRVTQYVIRIIVSCAVGAVLPACYDMGLEPPADGTDADADSDADVDTDTDADTDVDTDTDTDSDAGVDADVDTDTDTDTGTDGDVDTDLTCGAEGQACCTSECDAADLLCVADYPLLGDAYCWPACEPIVCTTLEGYGGTCLWVDGLGVCSGLPEYPPEETGCDLSGCLAGDCHSYSSETGCFATGCNSQSGCDFGDWCYVPDSGGGACVPAG